MREEALTDPVENAKEEQLEIKVEQERKAFDINNLTMRDFHVLAESFARTPGPFDGYPLKPEVDLGKAKISATHVVALNPKELIIQDPSGKAHTVWTEVKDKMGKTVGRKNERIVILKTYHSRVLKDGSGVNTDIVFDRSLNLADGNVVWVSIVRDYVLRSRLMYKLTRDGRVQVDRRYLLLDPDQAKRLRKTFEIIINPHLKIERVARAISEESDESLDNIPE